jgi:hypothetical protein
MNLQAFDIIAKSFFSQGSWYETTVNIPEVSLMQVTFPLPH